MHTARPRSCRTKFKGCTTRTLWDARSNSSPNVTTQQPRILACVFSNGALHTPQPHPPRARRLPHMPGRASSCMYRSAEARRCPCLTLGCIPRPPPQLSRRLRKVPIARYSRTMKLHRQRGATSRRQQAKRAVSRVLNAFVRYFVVHRSVRHLRVDMLLLATSPMSLRRVTSTPRAATPLTKHNK